MLDLLLNLIEFLVGCKPSLEVAVSQRSFANVWFICTFEERQGMANRAAHASVQILDSGCARKCVLQRTDTAAEFDKSHVRSHVELCLISIRLRLAPIKGAFLCTASRNPPCIEIVGTTRESSLGSIGQFRAVGNQPKARLKCELIQ